MHDEYAFGHERVESDWLHGELFDAFYRDLEIIGADGMMEMRKPLEKKVWALTRARDHFEHKEEYEKCRFIQSVLARVVER